MKKRILFSLVLFALAEKSLAAQKPEERGENAPRANQGHLPPPPAKRDDRRAKPEPEHQLTGHVNTTPVSNDHWYGHDRPDDKRFRLARPFEHSRFDHFGPSYRYRIERFDREHRRFWLPGGFFFEIAVWGWPIASGWCWDCADDFVINLNPDHDGWYLLYNVHTGVYIHATYLGSERAFYWKK